ncbi:MAG: hypothetical protein JSW66_17525 [Phycisphaerales bacterium]|nr:MAG: hypothetical protein JSW66_17525 [Phycisphaerales bacterium]
MNGVVKAMFALGVVLLSVGAIGGCKGKENGKEDHVVFVGKEHAIYGKYYNGDDPNEYIEIRDEGTAYCWLKNDPKFVVLRKARYSGFERTWRVRGDEILLMTPLGDVRGKIMHDNSILLYGKSWARRMEDPQDTSMPSGDSVGGIDSLPDDKMTWVKCNNTNCKAEYEMSVKQYFKNVEERMNPAAMLSTPTLICQKCNEASVYKAFKCGNSSCGAVFVANSVPNDFADRCPKCGRSEVEETRKRRRLQ